MSQKLKVVRVVTASHVVPWHLNNTLRRISADFEVCVVGLDVSKNQELYPNIKFVDIGISRKPNFISDGLALIELCRFFVSYKPDIVHSIMPKAGLLAAIAGYICRIPIRIHTFTGQTWGEKSSFSWHVYYWLDRLINSVNTVCLTDSFSQSKFLFENKISYLREPLPVISKGSLSGVDIERFNLDNLAEDVAQLRLQLDLDSNYFVFGFIARKTRAKGAIDILNAFFTLSAACNRVKLLFVGPDEDGEIARLCETNPELFSNVINVDYVNNHEAYLAIIDVLCLPSYREGFGSIVIDAAAMGIPTIGTRIPGLTDSVMDRETGLLFPVGDVNELVSSMQRFIDDPEMRKLMGENAKARVDEYFTADQLYFGLKEVYLQYAKSNLSNNKLA